MRPRARPLPRGRDAGVCGKKTHRAAKGDPKRGIQKYHFFGGGTGKKHTLFKLTLKGCSCDICAGSPFSEAPLGEWEKRRDSISCCIQDRLLSDRLGDCMPPGVVLRVSFKNFREENNKNNKHDTNINKNKIKLLRAHVLDITYFYL